MFYTGQRLMALALSACKVGVTNLSSARSSSGQAYSTGQQRSANDRVQQRSAQVSRGQPTTEFSRGQQRSAKVSPQQRSTEVSRDQQRSAEVSRGQQRSVLSSKRFFSEHSRKVLMCIASLHSVVILLNRAILQSL